MWPFSSSKQQPAPSAPAPLSDADFTARVVGAVASRPDGLQVRNSLLVRLMNLWRTTMAGEEAVDALPGADARQPLAAFVYPFAHITGGGGSIVIGTSETGEPYVLLARNQGKEKWNLPGGYMNPRMPFNRQGIYTQDTPERNNYDVHLMKTGAAPPAGAKPINQLTRTVPVYDKSLEETARRELQEETGLALPSVRAQSVLSETMDPALPSAQGPQTGQQHDEFFLFDIRDRKGLPPVRPSDDVQEVRWVKLANLQEQNGEVVAEGRQIGKEEVKAISAALHHMRQQEVEAYGVTLDRVRDFIAEARPSEFSPEAETWHRQALQVAQTMQKKLEEFRARKQAAPTPPSL